MEGNVDESNSAALAQDGVDSKEPAHPFDLAGSSFQSEYDRELGKLLRRRLGWLCLAFALWELLALGGMLAREFVPPMVERYATQEFTPPVLLEAVDEAEPPVLLAPNVAPAENVAPVNDELTPSERARARRDERRSPWGTAERTAGRELGIALGSFVDGLRNGFASQPNVRSPRRETMDSTGASAIDPSALKRTMPRGKQPPRKPQTAPLTVRDREQIKQEIATTLPSWLGLLTAPIVLGILAWVGLVKRPKLTTRRGALRAASKLILLLGATKLAFETGTLLIDRDAWVFPLFSICFWHFAACLFLPWSPRESLRPVWPLFFAWIAVRAAIAGVEGGWLVVLFNIAFAPLLFAPGLFVCYYRLRWHENEFKAGFAGDRFRLLRQELGHARKLHETLFPKVSDDGHVRFDFVYRPAAQIGGDFVHHEVDDAGRTTVLLIDVVGHGIASALTVARVQGELERLLSEHPDDGPGALLHRLNHYFRKLLAKHRLFATAIAVRLDAVTGELRWANAGHPPAIVRNSRSTTTLDSTTFLLGAVDGEAFGTEEQSLTMSVGDSVILYTDGLIEAANLQGDRFGIERLQSTLARVHPGGRWAQILARLAFTHAAGEQQDDILIVELHFRAARVQAVLATSEITLQTSSISA
ncbi:MAG: serine/threonine-protein phosphatase [Phycisphaerales bacterium]|nr:serine/threonine-protein phosphatase [Phycisphaerales bacterium]